jgi:hypothetical protein
MKRILPNFVFATVTTLVCLAQSYGQQESPSAKIDAFIESGYKQHKVTPNAPISDELFCRRIYLDVVGRIPSRAEALEFQNDTTPGKRAKLIDKLVESEGFVSHFYNYWADILRVRTDMQNEAGAAYGDWVKKAVRSNMPYDQLVKELVGAQGYIWDNGAVGYYMRDAGMPLDNMSNTAQIFLGTRVVCAQCHNHPFDKWKQKDYYDMAAFTYGVQTEINVKDICPDLEKEFEKDEKKAAKGRPSEGLRKLQGAIADILEPLSYGVSETKPELKLPTDYKEGQEGYEGKAGEEIVKAKTLFGIDRIDKPGLGTSLDDSNNREALIKWMCDKQNPRFTMVIANRLWKRTMGIGLVEPVDDFKDDTVASNQPLMKFLCEEMSRDKYDMRKFLKTLYNTKTYQRESAKIEVSTEVPYYFPGPVLRRMSGEQIWDSIVTLMIPNPDYRKKTQGYSQRLESMRTAADELKKRYIDNPNGAKALIAMAKAGMKASEDFNPRIEAKRKEVTAAREKKDDKLARQLQQELAKLTEEKDVAMYKAQADEEKKSNANAEKSVFFKRQSPSAMEDDTKEKKPMMGPDGKPVEQKDPMGGLSGAEWTGYSEEYFRASELSSPAPENHFLRAFGQSDRNVIENAWIDASVPQALSLMNGQIFDDLVSDKSVLAKTLKDAITPTEKAKLLWLTSLGRSPTDDEKKIVTEIFSKLPESRRSKGWQEIFWSILNGREFIFIQ